MANDFEILERATGLKPSSGHVMATANTGTPASPTLGSFFARNKTGGTDRSSVAGKRKDRAEAQTGSIIANDKRLPVGVAILLWLTAASLCWGVIAAVVLGGAAILT